MTVRIDGSLEGIDWTRAKADLAADDFDNGRGPRALRMSFEQAQHVAIARDGDRVLSRFFFPKYGAVVEDPGTGSACANLGGWLLATEAPLPQRVTISQGETVGRPCRLGLEVTVDRRILVSGRVVELGRGTITL